MSRVELFRRMATYNQWMNEKLLSASKQLDAEALVADRGAFFGSILATLNHLANSDVIWLKRFSHHPGAHASLDPLRALPMPDPRDLGRFGDLDSLAEHRRWLDLLILDWASSLSEADLDVILPYTNTRGVPGHKAFAGLVLHFFNHQTHHRGQVTTLFSQAGIDVGVTDLLALVPDHAPR